MTVTLAGCAGLGDDDGDGDGDGTPGGGDTPTDRPPEERPSGGAFSFGMPNEFEALNVMTASTAYTWSALDIVSTGGTYVDLYTFDVRPWVFTDWEVADPEADQPVVHFDVRDDLTWNDGEEFTIDDVLFTYEWYKENEPARYLSSIRPYDSIREADNDWDLALQFNQPFSTYDAGTLGLPLIAEHEWGDVEDHTTYETDDPVGLGAGRFADIDHDVSARVELRDPEEWPLMSQDWVQEHPNLAAGGPFLDEVRFRIFGSISALTEGFLQGEVDSMYDDSFEVTQANRVEQDGNLSVLTGYDDGYRHYTVNLRTAPFDCVTFRQALSFCLDRFMWADQLNRGYMTIGNYVSSNAYPHLRPEQAADADINEPDATRALWFRESSPGVVDVEAVRQFLQEGQVVGQEGTYAGMDFGGTLTGTQPSQTEPVYEYTIDEAQSEVLVSEGFTEELYVDGGTIPELLGRPLTMLSYPPRERPQVVQLTRNFLDNMRQVGIPIERQVMTFDTMLAEVYQAHNYDIYPMGWAGTSPFGVGTMYNLFHSDNTHEDPPGEAQVFNPAGYGLDGLAGADAMIEEARREMDVERRDELVRGINERIFLDAPTYVKGYAERLWPVNTAEYGGFLDEIPGIGSSTGFPEQATQIYQRE